MLRLRLRLRRDLADAALRTLGYASRDVTTSAGRVHLLQASGRGHAPPIVLLHGLSSRGSDFLPLLGRLRPHTRHLVAPDLPGHGRSEAPPDLGDLDACARGLAEALHAVLPGPAVIFGNSFGGLVALRLAVHCPPIVRGLFLASPAGAPSSPEELGALQEALRVETHADALLFLDRVLHARPPLCHVLAWGLRRRFASPVTRAVIAHLGPDPVLPPADLASVRAPIHLVWGRSDRLLPRSHLAFFRAHLPHARFEEPSHFGHSPQLDAPGDLVRDLVAFARRLP